MLTLEYRSRRYKQLIFSTENKYLRAAIWAFWPTSWPGWCLGALLALAVSGLSLNAGADQSAASEYGLKAVLFFKLPQFVYRPATGKPQNKLVFCVLGNNPFGKTLERLAREAVDGRTVEIVNLGSVGDGNTCDYIFISRSESASVETILQKFAGKHVVTVSDIPDFARAGGMVELTLTGEHVGVTLNRKAAQKQELEFNAQLLRLAKVVEP